MKDGPDVTIERHKAAMLKHEERLSQLRADARGACCPTCFHGSVFTKAVEHAERCGQNLVRLLSRRGQPADRELIEAMRIGAWP
jgi:uncharacterized protein (DUF983 family)